MLHQSRRGRHTSVIMHYEADYAAVQLYIVTQMMAVILDS